MPGYNNQQQQGYRQAYTPSAVTSEDHGYYSEYSSQVNLAAAAAPMARMGGSERGSMPWQSPQRNYQTETFGAEAQPGYAVSTDANGYGYDGDAYGGYEQDIGRPILGTTAGIRSTRTRMQHLLLRRPGHRTHNTTKARTPMSPKITLGQITVLDTVVTVGVLVLVWRLRGWLMSIDG